MTGAVLGSCSQSARAGACDMRADYFLGNFARSEAGKQQAELVGHEVIIGRIEVEYQLGVCRTQVRQTPTGRFPCGRRCAPRIRYATHPEYRRSVGSRRHGSATRADHPASPCRCDGDHRPRAFRQRTGFGAAPGDRAAAAFCAPRRCTQPSRPRRFFTSPWL